MLGYNILLCCLLLFFAYQNSRIKTHFQQEGEFAAKAVVLVFLFVFLGTVVILLLNHRRENVNEYFGVNSVFVLGIPTAILSLLFVPKVQVILYLYMYSNCIFHTLVCNGLYGTKASWTIIKKRGHQQKVYRKIQHEEKWNTKIARKTQHCKLFCVAFIEFSFCSIRERTAFPLWSINCQRINTGLDPTALDLWYLLMTICQQLME